MLLGYVLSEGNPCLGRALVDIKMKCVVVAIVRGDKTIIPRGDDVLEAGDKMYIVVRKEDVAEVEGIFEFSSTLPNQVFIVGGSDIGRMTASRLEDLGIEVRLIEKDMATCKRLTEQLDNTVLLNCDGLEAHDLIEEEIEKADIVVAVTGSDTTNILSSLLAKHHGASKCITKISRPDFIPMLGNLGIDMALSPRLVAANMILRYVRGSGSIVSAASLLGSDAEVVEMRVPPSDRFDGVPLRELSFPRGAIVGAVVRSDGAMIPTGNTILDMDDRLIVFLTSEARGELESFFKVT